MANNLNDNLSQEQSKLKNKKNSYTLKNAACNYCLVQVLKSGEKGGNAL